MSRVSQNVYNAEPEKSQTSSIDSGNSVCVDKYHTLFRCWGLFAMSRARRRYLSVIQWGREHSLPRAGTFPMQSCDLQDIEVRYS